MDHSIQVLLHFSIGDYFHAKGAMVDIKVSLESFWYGDSDFHPQNRSSARKIPEITWLRREFFNCNLLCRPWSKSFSKKDAIRPSKTSQSKKNDLLVIQVSQWYQTNSWSKTHVFLSIPETGTYRSTRNDEKTKKNVINKRKKSRGSHRELNQRPSYSQI